MKQTAVEWLVHELDKQMIERDKFDAFDWIFEDLIKQAEAMEKEQIIEAATRWKGTDFAEQYYNETYNK